MSDWQPVQPMQSNNLSSRPWQPASSTAYAIIVFLLMALFACQWLQNQRESKVSAPASKTASLQARAQELISLAQRLAPAKLPLTAPVVLDDQNPWDGAVEAILQAEHKATDSPKAPTMPDSMQGALFLRAFQAAYGTHHPLSGTDIEPLRMPLGNGYAFRLLSAKMAERRGEDSTPYRQAAQRWAMARLAGLGIFSAAITVLVIAGIANVVLLFTKPRENAVMPSYGMSWQVALIVLLSWLLALRLSGSVALLFIKALKLPTVCMLPLATTFHATVGLLCITHAEGLSLSAFWRRLTPGPKGKALLWGVGFLGMALCAVLVVSQLFAPLMRGMDTPQREIRELVFTLSRWTSTVLVGLTIAFLAPFFEEVFFRGFVMPWLGVSMEKPLGKKAWPAAVLLSGLLFGLIHFQLAALPVLTTLGMVLGWAFFYTRNLWTAILIHCCWNGGTFLLMRLLC